jgi:hypothetical protein
MEEKTGQRVYGQRKEQIKKIEKKERKKERKKEKEHHKCFDTRSL